MNINKENYLSELRLKNPAAIEFIVCEYGSLIKSVLNKYLYCNNEALDECFNDILLAIWNNTDKFDDKKNNFKNWICAIAKYRAIDTLRKEMKRNERFISIENDQNFDWLTSIQLSVDGMEQVDVSMVELEKLLKCLSAENKDLFFRRYVKDQSIKEIAEETKMSQSLIYSRISRGKKRIKKHMECQTGGVIK